MTTLEKIREYKLHREFSSNNEFSENIRSGVGYGMSNNEKDVREIQGLLKALGYKLYQTGRISKSFQDNTIAAILDFQRKKGLTTDGKIAPNGETIRALIATQNQLMNRPVTSPKAAQMPMITPFEAAVLANDVYDPCGKSLAGEWKMVQNYKKMGFVEEEGGYRTRIYARINKHNKREFAIAYAGTIEIEDWKNNFQQLIGDAQYYNLAKKNAKSQLVENLKTQGSLVWIGHSLGGGLSTYSGLITGDKVVTFNPAWLSIYYSQGYRHHRSDIINFVVHDEILTSIQNLPIHNFKISKYGIDIPIYISDFVVLKESVKQLNSPKENHEENVLLNTARHCMYIVLFILRNNYGKSNLPIFT